MTPLLGVDEAQARLLAGVEPLPSEDAPFANALGRILAADVVARLTQPPFAASAMDGYAIRMRDLPGPWRVVGESAAGRRFGGHVGPGEAVRILTGAPLPAGADTVVVQEEVVRSGDALTLTGEGPPRQGAHIRPAGLDFAAGTVVARATLRVTPARIGVAAAAGHATLPVHRRPRVALLATGDELVPPGTTPGPDAIVSSNGVMLAALLGVHAGVTDGGIVADTPEALTAAIRAHTGGPNPVDVLVTIGGASVGDHDHVVPVLTAMGADIDFWKIALRPGKPMLSGRLGGTRIVGPAGGARIVGLPGNPVSAFVCATLFVVPLLKALGGDPSPLPVPFEAAAGVDLPANGPRRDYLRARLADGAVVPFATQDSAMLHVLADSNVLVVREPHARLTTKGTMVPCIALDTISGVA